MKKTEKNYKKTDSSTKTFDIFIFTQTFYFDEESKMSDKNTPLEDLMPPPPPAPPAEKKSAKVTASIFPSRKRKVVKWAEELGVSQSGFINLLISAFENKGLGFGQSTQPSYVSGYTGPEVEKEIPLSALEDQHKVKFADVKEDLKRLHKGEVTIETISVTFKDINYDENELAAKASALWDKIEKKHAKIRKARKNKTVIDVKELSAK